jgi:hypothetical protein
MYGNHLRLGEIIMEVARLGSVLFLITMLAAAGCTQPSVSTPPMPATNSTPTPSEQESLSPSTAPVSSEPIKAAEDITFSEDFNIPEDYRIIRSLKDDLTSPDAVYQLAEYSVTVPLASLDQWLREEAKRLGGKVAERYGYENRNSVELIIELPSKTGSRFISTYTPKYVKDQHLVVIETSFKQTTVITRDTEDHALVVVVPQPEGGTREIFMGNYEHQHTDIYSAHFFTNAFFQQLVETAKYTLLTDQPDYTIGYFDSEGQEIFPDQIDASDMSPYKFGANLNRKFLPKDGLAMKMLLSSWAQTVLAGNKAVSHDYDGSETFYFLENGRAFAAYTLTDILMQRNVREGAVENGF